MSPCATLNSLYLTNSPSEVCTVREILPLGSFSTLTILLNPLTSANRKSPSLRSVISSPKTFTAFSLTQASPPAKKFFSFSVSGLASLSGVLPPTTSGFILLVLSPLYPTGGILPTFQLISKSAAASLLVTLSLLSPENAELKSSPPI